MATTTTTTQDEVKDKTALNGETPKDEAAVETPTIEETPTQEDEATITEEDTTTGEEETTTTTSTSVAVHPFKERLDTFKMQEWQLKPSLPQSPSSIDDTATVTLVR